MDKLVASHGYKVDIPEQIWLFDLVARAGETTSHVLKSKNGDIIQHYDTESPKPHMFQLEH
jgi:hypothetical protein